MAVRNARSQSFLTSYRKIEDCEQYNVQASTVFFLLFIFQLLSLLFSDGYDQAFSSFSENNCHSILFPEQWQAIEPMHCKDKCQTIK